MNNNNLPLHNPRHPDDPLHSPPNVTVLFIRHYHPPTPRLLSWKRLPHIHHEWYQDVQWDKGSPPFIE